MSDEHKHEIVIIRRGGHGDHDEHHGGVWKIAFADFMTAMMAFFLVMWLISANDKTRASVARYFNPVRLVDATTQPRGLHDTKKDESGITASPDGKAEEDKNKKSNEGQGDKKEGQDEKAKAASKAAPETTAAREKRLDAALRENPFVALAEIAAPKKPLDPGAAIKAAESISVGRQGGEAFRDPFAPPPPALPDDDLSAPDTPVPAKAAHHDASASDTASAGQPAPATTAEVRSDKHDEEVKAISEALRNNQDKGPRIDVKGTAEGVLVSLTDTTAFSMFASGSAVPARKVVLMMERVAQTLKARKGNVVVRGFTDNKPYRSGRYDNWHLSLDRAQVAHYMLVRGGLDDARIGHVEGYADRQVRTGSEASNPVNRRIEILLRDEP